MAQLQQPPGLKRRHAPTLIIAQVGVNMRKKYVFPLAFSNQLASIKLPPWITLIWGQASTIERPVESRIKLPLPIMWI